MQVMRNFGASYIDLLRITIKPYYKIRLKFTSLLRVRIFEEKRKHVVTGESQLLQAERRNSEERSEKSLQHLQKFSQTQVQRSDSFGRSDYARYIGMGFRLQKV